MTFKQLISISLLSILIILPNVLQAKENHPVYKSKRSDIAIKGYDTVAYFTKSTAIKGSQKISYQWHDATWLFSSEEHKAIFIKSPEKYAPQYGGWCAYAMSDGRAVKIDPEAFEIYNEKLYLNYSKSVQGHWRKEKDLFISQANGHYPNVVELALLEK